MDLRITENITANVSLKDIEGLIKESARKDGYDVIKITPVYGSTSSKDQRDTYGSVRDFTGFKVDLKRRVASFDPHNR
jgi:hypothetical protein